MGIPERLRSWWPNEQRGERASLTLWLLSPGALQVDVGEAEPLQVVTNAPNVVRGMAVCSNGCWVSYATLAAHRL